ncbi:MAG: ferrochelatase [Planctomycetaceae bacterium]|nr:ferrochelatase [Planctomycetaceae bacterium]
MNQKYDAVLVVGFGGPEKREDVLPFLENVLRGRNVPRERMLEVAEHYYHFGGVSPINAQTRRVIDALEVELKEHQIDLPIYWGNRNWHPMLADTMQKLADEGKRRVLALVLAAYSSYSSCRQYREDIERARAVVGETAPEVDKIRVFFNHPNFIAANAFRLSTAVEKLPKEQTSKSVVVYTAHSLPLSMSQHCDYEMQLRETCRLVSESVGVPPENYHLVYQSRSGRPQDPWLEPDVCDFLEDLNGRGVTDVLVMPIGFLSDHMEVLFDLDEEAQQKCDELGLNMIRVETVGTHPLFIGMLRELIEERMDDSRERQVVGHLPSNPDVCAVDCCPAPMRRTGPTTSD